MNGIIRKIDSLGRFVIPKEWRDSLGIRTNDFIEIYLENEKVIIKRIIMDIIKKYIYNTFGEEYIDILLTKQELADLKQELDSLLCIFITPKIKD